MRILILSNKVPYPAKDGSSIAIRSMVEGLMLNDAKVHLLSLNTKKHYRHPAEFHSLLPKGLEFDKVDVDTDISPWKAFLNLLSGKAYHISRFLQSNFKARLKEELQNNLFDIVQLEGLSMAVYLTLIRNYSNAPVVLRAHNIEFQIWDRHRQHEKSFLKSLYLAIQCKRLKRFEQRVFDKVDASLFITKQDRKFYKSLGHKQQSLVAPCGLNPADYPLQEDDEDAEFDLIHLASLDWMPNQQGAIWFLNEVWPLVLEARPNTRMAFGGRNMPKEIIEKSSNKLWLYPEVKDAQEFVAKGKVAVVPLLAGSGMRIKLLEYLAWAKVTISTSIGAEGIDLEENKEILIADDAESFAAGIVYLLDDNRARMNMKNAARRFFEAHYDNKKLGKDILQFYGTLV